MSISAITIENFKGIREPVRVEFKPITLLFGPNSAGKSTIIQALHYAREIFEHRNLDPDATISGGEAVDLGGFKTLVHKQDLSRAITLRFDFELQQTNVDEYCYFAPGIETETDESEWIFGYFGDQITSNKMPWLQIVIQWSSLAGRPVVTFYQLGFGQELFAEITASSDGRQVALSYLDMTSPALSSEASGNLADNYLGPVILKDNKLQLNIDWQKDALPTGERIFFPHLHEMQQTENIGYGVFPTATGFEALLNSLLIAPIKYLKKNLSLFRYVGPLRKVPERGYVPALTENLSRWANGLAAWDVLYKGNNDNLLAKVNQWLAQEDKLNTGYSVVLKAFRELSVDSPLMLALQQQTLLDDDIDIKKELFDQPIKRRLFLWDEKQNFEVSPMDIGVGISQVLPVVVLALSSWNGILAIEQPELHIHPALQVALGDLFIEEIRREHGEVLEKGEYQVGEVVEDVSWEDLMRTGQNAPASKVFLLETHSEHLLLRMLRRIREATQKALPKGTAGLTPDQLAVYFIEQDESIVQVSRIRIDEEGDFVDRWPHGFFDERAGELF